LAFSLVAAAFSLLPFSVWADPANSVSAGYTHTCALTSAGAVQCWGRNASGQLGDGTTTTRLTPATVSGLPDPVVSLSVGDAHTCVVTSSGAVWCWGDNGHGQLGDGTITNRLAPVAVGGLGSGVVAVAAGFGHTCALTSGGAVWCWGENYNGQLGDGTTTSRFTPVAVSGLGSDIVAVSAGGYHTCALTSGGAVWCWGANGDGQLGDSTTTPRTTPVEASGVGVAVGSIDAGSSHTCAVTAPGAVWCWGRNGYGQLGDGTTTTRLTPVAVSGLGSSAAAVSAGDYFTCATTNAGTSLCWGANAYGKLGDGTTTDRWTPVTVGMQGSGVVSVSAGTSHACAVTSVGAVWCWGDNTYGTVGDGTSSFRTTPVGVIGFGSGVAAVAAGDYHTCAITSAGGVLCWGANSYGQLGDGTTTYRLAPVAVSGLASDVVAASAGYRHTCVVTSAGAVWCWGRNDYGQLGDGTTTDRTTPVAVSGLESGVVAIATGTSHSCASTSAGAVRCWGSNSGGQLGDGTTTNRPTPVTVSGLGSGAVAVTAGDGHSCALTSGGAVSCWGWNFYGQLGDGTTTQRATPVTVTGLESGVVGVDAGGGSTCAVTNAGAALCWGGNSYGQLGDGSTTNRLTPVAVGGLGSGVSTLAMGRWHGCAVTTGGALLCWGHNSSGQLGDGTMTARATPGAVNNMGSGVVAVTTGEDHTCAVNGVGAAWCWGWNIVGQVGDGTSSERHVPIPTIGFRPLPSDLNRDGRADLVWRHATGGDLWVWPMTAGVPASQTHLGTVADTGWQIVGLGDQSGDARADLLWRHQISGGLFLWTMNGTTIAAMQYLGAVVPDYAIVGTADYTGDEKTDILWRHQTTGELWLWRMNGATLEAVTWVATIPPVYAVVASGDVNGDGRVDLLWRHQGNGDVWLWLMNGATPTSQVYLGAVTDLAFQVAGFADFDRNGRADVLWHHATSGDVWLWRMDGPAIVGMAHVATVGDVNFHVAGVGDYDGDGRADVLWHHATSGAVWVWVMNGSSITSATQVATVPDVGYQVVSPR